MYIYIYIYIYIHVYACYICIYIYIYTHTMLMCSVLSGDAPLRPTPRRSAAPQKGESGVQGCGVERVRERE